MRHGPYSPIHSFSLSALIFVVLTIGAASVSAGETGKAAPDDTSSRRITFGARLGWSWFVQHGGYPPLCCGERDSWTTSGPVVDVSAAYEFWSWLAAGLQFGYARYITRADGQARHFDLVDFQARAFVEVISGPSRGSCQPFDFGIGLHVASAWLSGEIVEVDGEQNDISETAIPVGLHLRLERTVGPDLALGVTASTQYHPVSLVTVHGIGLTVSWSPR